MNCPDCDKQLNGPACTCGWVKPGTLSKVVWRNTEGPRPTDGMTREQFGLNLYHAIELVGGIAELRVIRGHAAMGELPKAYGNECKAKEDTLIDELRSTLLHLKAEDMTEFITRYPWVAAL